MRPEHGVVPRIGAVLALAAALACPAPLSATVAPAPAPAAASGVGARPPDAACPPGNLLVAARLVDSLDADGSAAFVVDDIEVPEGVPWARSGGVAFLTAAGSLTYDLGAERPIVAASVQAAASNAFALQVSNDGREFREIWQVPLATHYGGGMRTRSKLFWNVRARYVRFGEASGFGPRAVTELQVFCDIPGTWPPRPAVVAPPEPKPGTPRPWYRPTRQQANAAKLALALAGALLLGWGYFLERKGAPGAHRRLRDGLLIALGILGLTGYYNWGGYHFPARVHYYEFFHYYIGSKYFPELGYTGIYACACLAEAEQGFGRRVELRRIRDLSENELVSARYVLEDPARFKKGFTRPFTPARWEEFKKDMTYFREKTGIVTWEKMLMDHGYNPPPMWNMAASLLSNLGPASDRLIEGALSWIDPVLVLVTFALITWAFGWRAACVAALFFGTNEPALYFWTGGAYLRQDWFFWAMAGICLLKRRWFALGGASLAASMLTRVFPAGFFAAIGLRLLWIVAKERRIDRGGARIVIGAIVAVAILVPASSLVAGGFSAWPAFFKNIEKHESTPLTNDMGLRTLVAFRWDTRQKVTYHPSEIDPFHEYREARKSALRGLFGRPLFYALVLGYLALLFFRVVRREMEWWVLAAFGFGVIPVSLEMTCYYYSFLTAAAFLLEKRSVIPVGLLALAAVTQFVEFQTYYYDIRYSAESVVVLAFVVWATWVYGARRRETA